MYETLEHWKQYKQKKEAYNTKFMLVDKDLQIKIAKEFSLPVSDNSSKLVSDYDKKEFDEWMNGLIAKNGTTNY